MNMLSRNTGLFLKYGIYAAVAVLVVGVLTSFISTDIGNIIINVGIFILVFIPFLSIIVSAVALYREKDMYWLKVTLLLIAISVIGIILAYVA